jgi:hypothetical protein
MIQLWIDSLSPWWNCSEFFSFEVGDYTGETNFNDTDITAIEDTLSSNYRQKTSSTSNIRYSTDFVVSTKMMNMLDDVQFYTILVQPPCFQHSKANVNDENLTLCHLLLVTANH